MQTQMITNDRLIVHRMRHQNFLRKAVKFHTILQNSSLQKIKKKNSHAYRKERFLTQLQDFQVEKL